MLGKILLTTIIILIVGYGLRWLGTPPITPREPDPNQDNGGSDTPLIDDMIQCNVCDNFVSKSGHQDCNRKNCPFK